jgi:8-amino-7-oxononanoate synthase
MLHLLHRSMPSAHFTNYLREQLTKREQDGLLRSLKLYEGLIDFTSNDYLGIARNHAIFQKIAAHTEAGNTKQLNGSGGSRLLSGNSSAAEAFETYYATYIGCEAALLFNSGYDANVGLLSSLPQRGDTIISDSLVHASIIDGIRLSHAKRLKFAHNITADLERKLRQAKGKIYVVVESVYSMDGDEANLIEIAQLCNKYDAALIVDEAHAIGIRGKAGRGLVDEYNLSENVFARIHTFGKAIGCHGACIVGSKELKQYLINFARPFIYSTALPPHSIQIIQHCIAYMRDAEHERELLASNIKLYKENISPANNGPIQKVIIPGNEAVRKMAHTLQQHGYDIRPILSPTVAAGEERLRIILHSFNTSREILQLTKLLKESRM